MALFKRAKPKPGLDITIVGIDDLEKLAGVAFTKVVSISDVVTKASGGSEPLLRRLFPTATFHFSYFDDVEYPKLEGPDRNNVYRILNFSRTFTLADKILIHCRAGISRSTAIACAIACQHSPPGDEKKVIEQIRAIRSMMLPNFLIIKLADEILDRRGALMNAITQRRGGF
jgi:predicted protein tyrosine phosphatase